MNANNFDDFDYDAPLLDAARFDADDIERQIARDDARQRALLVLVVVAAVATVGYTYITAVQQLLEPLVVVLATFRP